MTDFDCKYKLLKLCLDIAEKESERFWSRSNIFVSINAGLFGITAIMFDRRYLSLIPVLSIFGIVTSLAWAQILRTGKFYAARWRRDAKEIAASDDTMKETLASLMSTPRIRRPWGPVASKCMLVVSIVCFLLWVVILVFCLSEVGKSAVATNEPDSHPKVESSKTPESVDAAGKSAVKFVEQPSNTLEVRVNEDKAKSNSE